MANVHVLEIQILCRPKSKSPSSLLGIPVTLETLADSQNSFNSRPNRIFATVSLSIPPHLKPTILSCERRYQK